MQPGPTLRVAIAPHASDVIAAAVVNADAVVADCASADTLVWTDPLSTAGLAAILDAAPQLRWIQLPSAGVDDVTSLLGRGHTWTSAKGAYAQPVAEHALALSLAGLGQLRRTIGDGTSRPIPSQSDCKSLFDAKVTIVGGGGIAKALLTLLRPFRAEVTVVRRHVEPLPGALRVVGPAELRQSLSRATLVVLALPLTADTKGIIGADELRQMGSSSWLVNVARGAIVVTKDLVIALKNGTIGGAALDVTDPEPLPEGHALWGLHNCLITPHVAATWTMAEPLLANRVSENIRCYVTGRDLIGLVDATLGY